jgi:hypothetical protein
MRPGSATKRSPAERKAIDARRMGGTPIVVTGISPAKRISVTPSMFRRLDVDPAYQRGRTDMINKIVSALQEGGLVPDPVTIVSRPWSADPSKLWIVDGWQRVCAFQAMNLAFDANLHESESLEAERRLFIALNYKKGVSSNVTVKAWDGPSAIMLRAVNNDPGHPLYQRINFEQNTNSCRLEAGAVVRAMCGATSGLMRGGETAYILRRIDASFEKETGAKERARLFLRLIAAIFPRGRAPSMPMGSLALAAYQRWKSGTPALPSEATIKRLARVNWGAEIPAFNEKYRVLLFAVIDRIWKKSDGE